MHVKVFMRPTCPYSRRAMQLLRDKGVSFEAVDVSQDAALRAEMERVSGRSSVPQVFVGERHIGGCDDLVALDASGELDVLVHVGVPRDLTTSA